MNVKEKMQTSPIYGALLKIVDDPSINLLAKSAGMDFVFYDCEHGMYSYEKLHDLILAGNNMGIESFVRVPQLARGDISRVLDCGCSGVMVPMIESKWQAEELIRYSKYPPIGKRSYSGGANTNYRPSGNHLINMKEINRKTISIVQIETVEGVERIDEILSVDGIDAVIVGPADLGISMGIYDNVLDEREVEMIKKVVDACRVHHKLFGIIGGLPLVEVFKDDLDIVVSAIDVNLLRDGLKWMVEKTDEILK